MDEVARQIVVLNSSLPDRTPSRRSLAIAWIPAILWLMVIATESTKTFSGSNTFIWLLKLTSLFHLKLTAIQIYYVNAILRKAGHFTGYAILSWFAFRGWTETLACRAFHRSGRTVRRWRLRAAILAVLCTAVVAGLDEFHQAFLPGRTGVLHDVVLDSMGGVFAQLLLLLYWSWQENQINGTGQTLPSALNSKV